MHRLWFRLDDVLPLAEHAMVCFTHRITGGQAAATAPHGPALIWDGTPMMDLLTSNGVPVWHSDRGTVHAAEAYAWRDASGRYGTAYTDDYHTAYLPLADPAGEPGPVLRLLRGARHSDNRWVIIDIDPADGHLIAAHRMHLVSCRHDLVPADTAWTPMVVSLRNLSELSYPALVAAGYTSDSGDLIARFDRATIARMAADLDAVHANPDRHRDPMPGEYPILRLHGDGVTVIEEHDNGHAVIYRTTDHLTPDADGYYPLGAYLWPWQPVSGANG